MNDLDRSYDICVVDIGSPKLGNIGWSFINTAEGRETNGTDLDALISELSICLMKNGLILGLEAPLFVPIRSELMLATKARKGEGRRPWSAGAGAQVLAMNLPIMIYLFKRLILNCPKITFFLDPKNFTAKTGQILIFEALVSGADKGNSHVQDAQIMAQYCMSFSTALKLPATILENEVDTGFFNLAGAALLQCGADVNLELLHQACPIYKPN